MLFTEPTFLFVFLPILLALYQLPGVSYRNWLLLAASIIFYTRGAGNFTWLVLALIVFNYVAARLIDRHRATVLGRRLLAGAVAIDLLVLAVFKYADFAVGNLNAALALVGVQPFAPPGILLPIGISFFTFHAISYVVDVYRQDASAQKRPVKAALYLLVFPQLIAGPIVRYRQIAEQLSSRVTSLDDFAYGVRRFIIGLSKKMLIANTLAGPADQIFAMPAAELTALHAWTGVVCYTLQIYFDFSGTPTWPSASAACSASGSPRTSTTRTSPPLSRTSGGAGTCRSPRGSAITCTSRSAATARRRAGCTSTSCSYSSCVASGMAPAGRSSCGGCITGSSSCSSARGWPFASASLPKPLRHAYAVLVVMVGWVFFRADTLGSAVAMLAAMGGAGGASPAVYAPAWFWTTDVLLAIAAGAVGSTPVIQALAQRLASPAESSRALTLRWHGSIAALLALTTLLAASLMLSAARSYNPFIYFRF